MILVAGYCRVSTDKDDQANSFLAQKRYFRDYIAHHPDWQLYEIYADEGITGTSTKKRTQFNRMIADAREGKFQILVTKEVSRFSRNILDTISYTRELRSLGVGVRFLLDGIDTMRPDSELYLSIMASMAQEESRKTSSRVVWGQTRQMERGVVFGPSLLGYRVQNGKIEVEPMGAETVRLIFWKYAVEQMKTSELAAFLTQAAIPTGSGNTHWCAGTVLKILKNEKYVGDLVQKKTYTPNYLTHEKCINRGAVPLIRLESHHEPIISRELWNLAQNRLHCSSKSQASFLSGKIRCGLRGAAFVRRTQCRSGGTKYHRWCCGTVVNSGAGACRIGTLIREEDAVTMLHMAVDHLQLDLDEQTRKALLHRLIVYPDKHVELYLMHLPHIFHFVL